MNKEDLYTKLVCALTHDVSVCDSCKKCGENGGEVRVCLVKQLADYMGYGYPWEEEDDKNN